MNNNIFMTIGLASPISTGSFAEFLEGSSCQECAMLSLDEAPAVTTLARELLKMGHRLVIFTLDPKATRKMMFRGENIVVYVAPAISDGKWRKVFDTCVGSEVKLIKTLFRENTEKLDVMSVHWTRAYALAAKIYLGKLPVFVTVRDIIPYIFQQQKLGLSSYRWFAIYCMNELVMRNKAYRFIANSEYTAVMVKHYWGADIPVIPNPIDDSFFDLTYRATNSSTSLVLTTISTSQPGDKRKNISTLVKAFELVRIKRPNVVLNLVGRAFTDDNPQLKDWKEQGLLKNVVLRGAMSHDEVVGLLCETHLMVHPSMEETFGNTLIEAMAVGCPVLGGQKSGAVPYVLNHGEVGNLCDVSDEKEMANVILSILDHLSDAFHKATKAKEYCKKRFSSRRIAQEYVNMFTLKY